MRASSYRTHPWVGFSFVVASISAFASIAGATTFTQLRFTELVQKASAIARVRCINTQSKWEDNEIWTESQFVVVEQMKGDLPATVNVRMLGGDMGSIHSHVDGIPAFHPGEEVYVFFWARAGEPYRVLGWAQGAFRIHRDARTGSETVTQDSSAIPVYQPGSKAVVHAGVRELPIADFHKRVSQALGGSQP